MLKHFFLIAGLLVFSCFNGFGQTINEAELLLCENQVDKAAEIYDQLLDNKAPMLIQDYYNAAVCHIKREDFESAKKHLNKLAQRGVKAEELKPLSELVSAYEWETYMVTYTKFLAFGLKDNVYTQFETEMNDKKSQLEALQKRLQIIINVRNADKWFGPVDVAFEGKIVASYIADSTEPFFVKQNEVIDSIKQTQSYVKIKKDVSELKNKIAVNFMEFLEKHSWPSEKELNRNSLIEEGNWYFKMVNYIKGSTNQATIYIKEDQNSYSLVEILGLDSLNFAAFNSSIESLLLHAENEGKVKAKNVLQLKNSNSFQNLIKVKALAIIINDAGCSENMNKIYFESLTKELEPAATLKYKYLESREDLTKKYVYLAKNPDLYLFGINAQVEQAYFGSCESFKSYFQNKQLKEL